MGALSACGMADGIVGSLLEVLSGLLSLSRMVFVEAPDSDGSQLAGPNEETALQHAAALLGLHPDSLRKITTSRTLSAGRKADLEEYSVPLNETQATQTRDSIAKMIYSKLFSWCARNGRNAL